MVEKSSFIYFSCDNYIIEYIILNEEGFYSPHFFLGIKPLPMGRLPWGFGLYGFGLFLLFSLLIFLSPPSYIIKLVYLLFLMVELILTGFNSQFHHTTMSTKFSKEWSLTYNIFCRKIYTYFKNNLCLFAFSQSKTGLTNPSRKALKNHEKKLL